MKLNILVLTILLPPLSAACVHRLSMRSTSGDELTGRYRFSRENTGMMQITALSGELLRGNFITVARPTFIAAYEKAFGPGSIEVEGPDSSRYGNVYGGLVAVSSSLNDAATGETFSTAPGNAKIILRGPLFYWTASLKGERGATMGCYFIGSSYTGHGFGRCKADDRTEYSVDF
jgi:hypothetical protein